MEKKYQIFISSTYEDLKEERKKVQDTILSMYHFPIGMEMFSAADEEQWEIIRETIDSSDYYVLIIGHRYGSVIKEGEYAGISYTQKEFHYALEQKIPVLVFLIDKSVAIMPEKMEQDADKKEKLEQFKDEVKTGRIVQCWTNKDDLANKVAVALANEINRVKRPGWVRTQSLEGDDLNRKISELDQTVKKLDEKKQKLQKRIIELTTRLRQLRRLKRKEEGIILLRIGITMLLSGLFLLLGLALINCYKDNQQTNRIVGFNMGNFQENGSVKSRKNNLQEEAKIELNNDNLQDDENMGEEIQPLEEKDKNSRMVDWEWEYEGNADNMRRLLKNIPSELGIDVSTYQRIIDWEKVKADGIDFAIIRVGSRGYQSGRIYLDSRYKENLDGAKANGIKTGVYFYSQAINKDEMDEEINEILKAIEGYSLDYPVVIESVCGENNRTNELLTIEHRDEYIDLIKYFCTRIEQSGYTPMIYGTMEWFQQFPTGTFDEYYKWIYSPDSAPNDIDNCVIWQYKLDTLGKVNGIGNGVHVSINLSAYNGEND